SNGRTLSMVLCCGVSSKGVCQAQSARIGLAMASLVCITETPMQFTRLLVVALVLVAAPAALGQLLPSDEQPTPAREQERQGRARGAKCWQLPRQGRVAVAVPVAEQALALRRQMYPKARFPDGHHDLAVSLGNLGLMLQNSGNLVRAEPLLRDAVAM